MTTKTDILKAIRAKCLDCSVYQVKEVDLCPVQACALHPYRFGRDPRPSRKGRFQKAQPAEGDFDGVGEFE